MPRLNGRKLAKSIPLARHNGLRLAKSIPLARLEGLKKHTLAGGTSPGTFTMEEPPPPRGFAVQIRILPCFSAAFPFDSIEQMTAVYRERWIRPDALPVGYKILGPPNCLHFSSKDSEQGRQFHWSAG